MSDQGEPPEKEPEIKPPLVSGGSRFADQAERLRGRGRGAGVPTPRKKLKKEVDGDHPITEAAL